MKPIITAASGWLTEDLNTKEYLIVRHGTRHFGIEIWAIVEIIQMVEVSRLPESSPAMAGVINYRGEIIPVLDLGGLLDEPGTAWSSDMGIVIVSLSGELFGVLVEEVREVRTLSVLPRPDELAADVVWPLITGVAYLDDLGGLLLALSLERLWRQKKREEENAPARPGHGARP